LKIDALELDCGVNIFYGNNAQGKTNLLEAVYLLATGRSWRAQTDRELINFSKKEAHLKAYASNEPFNDVIEVHILKDAKKNILVNKVPIKKLGELYGLVHVVVFSPEDLSLIKSGPLERRKFLDVEMCQMSNIYYYNLKKYYHVLKQRNSLLKSAQIKPKEINSVKETLPVWDEQLILYGTQITKARREFVEKLRENLTVIHKDISKGAEDIEIIYKPNVHEDIFLQKLTKTQDKDIQTGTTGIGIHKDDLFFLLNGYDTRTYGSQGQQRSVCLSLRLSLTELIKKEKNVMPILLLDDVFSELDEGRQKYLLNAIGGIQTLITATGTEDILKKIKKADKAFYVKNGEIELY
jgi:DNA replication and repair protein RecF